VINLKQKTFHIYSRLKLLCTYCFLTLVFVACESPAAGETPKPMGPADFINNTVFFFLSMLFVYWILVLKPNQAAAQEREVFMEKLRKGEEVVTSGGLIGKVAVVKPDAITLEIAPNIKIRVLPDHVRPKPEKEGTESVNQNTKQSENKSKK
jgi:preprotein translocase subunit YajC